jgi:hypothetical protein
MTFKVQIFGNDQQIKVAFTNILRSVQIPGILTTIQFRTFCLLCKNENVKMHKTVILSVLYAKVGPLREEHRLRVFENRMLRRIFGPKRQEGTEDWRRLHIRNFILFTNSY